MVVYSKHTWQFYLKDSCQFTLSPHGNLRCTLTTFYNWPTWQLTLNTHGIYFDINMEIYIKQSWKFTLSTTWLLTSNMTTTITTTWQIMSTHHGILLGSNIAIKL